VETGKIGVAMVGKVFEVVEGQVGFGGLGGRMKAGEERFIELCALPFGVGQVKSVCKLFIFETETGNRSTALLFTGLLAATKLGLSHRAISPTALW
jgi:hypothetical protein